jgi:multiple sugar transport system ATP-binding protein
MNFVSGRINGGKVVTQTGADLPLLNMPANSDGKPVIYGIRPEHFHIADDGIPAEVVVIEPTGSETQVVARSGDHDIVCVFRDRVMPKPGEMIRLAPNPKLAHIFDAETGRRILN